MAVMIIDYSLLVIRLIDTRQCARSLDNEKNKKTPIISKQINGYVHRYLRIP